MIYSDNDATFLLGILCNDSSKCLDSKFPLDEDDFEGVLLHKIVYSVIYNLAIKGVKNVDSIMISEFLTNYPTQEEVYKDNNGNDFIETMIELTNNKVENIQYYWESIRKHSLLREYSNSGIDISEIWDLDKSDKVNEEELNRWSIDKIIEYYEEKQLKIKRKFTTEEDGTTRKKAGENGHEILIGFKESPVIGLSFESKYLTTLWGGFNKGQLYIRSGDTSSGKSRSCVGDLASVGIPEIYDTEQKKWVENPNGKHKILYIGSEMELNTECDPLFWAYISGVDSSSIIEGTYTKDEQKRIDRAIDIVNDNNAWLIDMPNFDIKKIEDEIKFHKREFDIEYVAFDYMLINQSLVREFVKNRGSGIGSRPDEVLLELSVALKNMCKEYNVGILTGTQVNAGISDFRARDYQVLRGGKAVADKATGGSISMPITKQELNLIEPYLKSEKIQGRGFGNIIEPNFVETIYKSRFSKFPKECKVFSYYDLGNMRKKELFVTDKNFKPIEIEPTIVKFIK